MDARSRCAVNPHIDSVDELLTLLGILAKREIVRARARSMTAMTVQVLEQGRYLGGRPPYGYHLVDVGPHPNRALDASCSLRNSCPNMCGCWTM